MQLTVLFVTLIFMALIALFFISAIRAPVTQGATTSSGIDRAQLVWGMLAFGLIVTLASLWTWPHSISGDQATVTINATGAQWSWEIDKEEVPLGRPVVFNVHTTDVTHGLGVVDSSGTLLFQTQGMPGYINKVEHVFTSPGEYRVICLEFCGIGHHDMITEFNVVSN